MPSGAFIPRRTTRLLPGAHRGEIDVLSIAKSLGNVTASIRGIQPRFNGSCFDITWNSEESAAHAASTGVDINGHHFELRLLGQKRLDVSVFVSVEFPDESIVEVLKPYGDFNPTIRHLYLKETGLTHIENGIRIIQFTRLDKPIPSMIVYRQTPLSFRYTGQPSLCFKCASAEHLVKDCPQNKKKPPADEVEDMNSEESHYETEREETPAGSSSDEGTSSSQPKPKRKRKRKRKDLATATANPPPAEETSANEESPALFTSPPSAENPPVAAPAKVQSEKGFQPVLGPRWKSFTAAMKAKGGERRSLMNTIPGPAYYNARALFLQYTFGDFTEETARTQHCQPKEKELWSDLSGTIYQDAYAELIRSFHDLQCKYELFPNSPQ